MEQSEAKRPGGKTRSASGVLALFLVLFLVCLAIQAAEAAFLPGINSRTLTHGGALRDFDVYAPATYTGVQELALVVDLHGFGSNKVEHRGLSGWTTQAETEGFLVVHPNGLFNSWNAGTCCGTAMTSGVDDVGFLRVMVEAIVAEGSVNPARIYVTGLSNGGAMSHRIACEAADLFAAAAPMAFPVPYTDFPNQCLPVRPIPVLAFMGLTDVVIPYSSGFFGGALPSLDAWRAKNVCGTGPLEVQETYGGSDCQIDTSCAVGTEVGLCSIRGSAFAPPLNVYNGHILYFNDDAVVLAARAWAFLDKFSLPVATIPVAGPLGWGMLGLGLAGAGMMMLRSRAQ